MTETWEVRDMTEEQRRELEAAFGRVAATSYQFIASQASTTVWAGSLTQKMHADLALLARVLGIEWKP